MSKVIHYHGYEFASVKSDGRECKCRSPYGRCLEPGTNDITKVTCKNCLKVVSGWVRKAKIANPEGLVKLEKLITEVTGKSL
jgi:hypothetical protein